MNQLKCCKIHFFFYIYIYSYINLLDKATFIFSRDSIDEGGNPHETFGVSINV